MNILNLEQVEPGRVVKILPQQHAVFVENGDVRKHVFCHQGQKRRLKVTNTGFVLYDGFSNPTHLPEVGDEAFFVRESTNPGDGKKYTKGLHWFDKKQWSNVSWAILARKRFRVIATNHRCNGQPQANFADRHPICEDTLVRLAVQYPLSSTGDGLERFRTSTPVEGMALTSDLIWLLEDDGRWVEYHEDPRPVDYRFK